MKDQWPHYALSPCVRLFVEMLLEDEAGAVKDGATRFLVTKEALRRKAVLPANDELAPCG